MFSMFSNDITDELVWLRCNEMAAWRNGIASDYDPFGVCNQEIAGSTPAVVTRVEHSLFPKGKSQR